MTLNVIAMLGLPGCGKGTQSILLSNRNGLVLWGLGKAIRSGSMYGTDEEKRRAKFMIDGGNLIPDDIAKKVIQFEMEKFSMMIPKPQVLLDGFPRSIPQAEILPEVLSSVGGILKAVILIEVDKSVVIDRLSSRIVCKICGESVMRGLSVCICGGTEFVKRSDDNAEVIKKRLEDGSIAIKALVDYYERNSPSILRVVNGIGDEEDVYRRIVAAGI